MRVLVTRPAAQAGEWVGLLQQAGLDAQALPLIAIAPVADSSALHAAWVALADVALVVFVSPNAASCFFEGRASGTGWPTGLLAASPGPGTTRVLRSLGVANVIEPAEDAAQFDSESLWARLAARDWQGREVLIVRGASGRDWLAERLRERGARLRFVAAYERAVPALSAEQGAMLREAVASPERHVWLFSSSEAIANLALLAPGASWSQAHAVATHPRIAQTARTLGIGQVLDARPTVEAVVACIQSIAS